MRVSVPELGASSVLPRVPPPPPGVGADRKAKSQAAFRPKQPGYLGSLANDASS